MQPTVVGDSVDRVVAVELRQSGQPFRLPSVPQLVAVGSVTDFAAAGRDFAERNVVDVADGHDAWDAPGYCLKSSARLVAGDAIVAAWKVFAAAVGPAWPSWRLVVGSGLGKRHRTVGSSWLQLRPVVGGRVRCCLCVVVGLRTENVGKMRKK